MNAANMRRVEQKGDLASTSVEAVLLSVEQTRQSARVWFETDIGVGHVAFSEGRVVAAEVGLLRRRSALLRLLGMSDGQYSIEVTAVPQGQPIVVDIASALETIAERQRQWRELCEATPPMSSVMKLTSAGKEFKTRATGVERLIYVLFDGRRTLMDVLGDVAADPIEALRVVVRGVSEGHFVDVVTPGSLLPLAAEESGEVPKIPLAPGMPRIGRNNEVERIQPVPPGRSSRPATSFQLGIRRGTLAGLGADISSSNPPPNRQPEGIEAAPIISVSGDGTFSDTSEEPFELRSPDFEIRPVERPREESAAVGDPAPLSEPADSLVASQVPNASDKDTLQQLVDRARYVGRYEVIHRIGRGGMGSVYLSRLTTQGGFRRLFALKLLRSYLAHDDDATEAFLAEARLAGRLHHPNVVGVVDAGVHRGQPYLVMDYIEGCSFKQLMSAHPKERPARLIVPIILGALEGLHAVHSLSADDGTPLEVVHCDISPENLLVGTDGTCRLTDLGVARRTKSDGAETTHGKPSYVAPEQVTRGTVDRRADLFAMGVVLWTALTGERLFQGATVDETIRRVCTQPILPPSRVGLRPDPALDEICMKALERDPENRYPTAETMHAALREVALRLDLLGLPSEAAAWVRATVGRELSQRRLLVLEASRPSGFALTPSNTPMAPGDELSGRAFALTDAEHRQSEDDSRTIRLEGRQGSWARVMLVVSAALATALVFASIMWPKTLSSLFRLNLATSPATAGSITIDLAASGHVPPSKRGESEPVVTPVVSSGTATNLRSPKPTDTSGTRKP